MTTLRIPGLIDPHVHLREPGATHKEDWYTGTCAALAGGITTVLAMPNTQPPLTDLASVQMSLSAAESKAVCDYGVYLGGTVENTLVAPELAELVAGLKLYLDDTFGTLRIDWRDLTTLNAHFANWQANRPLVCHAEERTVAAAILLAHLHNRPVHIAHVSRKSEIDCIRAAKEKGLPVTCEVGPHHLFLSTADMDWLGAGRCEVRPRLASPADQAALWQALQDGVVDCIATDHAPHTLAEKDSSTPPPGFPGLETSLALMLRAVHDGRIQFDPLIHWMCTRPREIFHLAEQPDTYVELDSDAVWTVRASEMQSRCGWTPYEGWQLRGRVERVTLRGVLAYQGGQVLAQPGCGQRINQAKL
ncbi:MAG TPA: amidohydrolase family protein [Anaerolineales bacterium]|nr:amidohydrolase family protein [Anaerolineales bacterium]